VTEPVRTIGIVSPGAMGSAVGHVLAQTGARIVATLDGRSERTAGLASRAGLELLPDLASVVRAADVILSIVPPGEAEPVAADVARAGADAGGRPLLVELNAISPQRVRRIPALNAHALDLVDGSISGPPPWTPGTTRIYLSGPRAAEVAALGWPGVELVLLGHELGLASAVKMCTASVYKGTAALLTHALVTARANGVLEHVLDDLASSLPVFVEGAERQIAGAATKAARYVAEMEEIAATQAEAGVSPALFEGLAETFRTLSTRPLAQRAPEDIVGTITLDEALAGLSAPAE
jgi:3-hydroxyisobutyrate dehydrogenase-like beta-hydroxyacid dehydrogenase